MRIAIYGWIIQHDVRRELVLDASPSGI